MDKALLLDSAKQLQASLAKGQILAWHQAVRQFNGLLEQAKASYPNRPDIVSMSTYKNVDAVLESEFNDAVRRFCGVLALREAGGLKDLVDTIKLPPDVVPELQHDLQELQEAVALELNKTALLFAGLIVEAMLLQRHPDKSDRGPGLAALLTQAKNERLFGRDTLRQIETLNDYRDLIHTRAGPRNRIVVNGARVGQAVMALKLVCSELEDLDVRYGM